jgi:hypothetical protein
MNKPIEELVIFDHYELKKMYEEYKAELDIKEAKKWFNQIVWELCRHSVGEELILYPLVKKYVPDGENIANESIKEHRETKEKLVELQSLDYEKNNLTFNEIFEKMMMGLFDHISKEESEDLTLLSKFCPLEERINAADKFENRKKIVPTQPHTWVNDKCPFIETIEGLLVAPIDKFFDLFKSYPEDQKLEKIEKGT